MASPDAVDEFELIGRLLRPLAEGAPEALGLMDDAAVLPARPGFDLAVSKDMIVEGVHFLASDPLDSVAQKLLRVNLSDLAAKGARPYGYFLAAAWPPACCWDQRAAFAEGLKRDQGRFGLKLLGGDTVSTPGPLTLSVTILGHMPHGAAVLRAGAQPGDLVLVSGAIGDGWLGLAAAKGEGAFDAAARARLVERYRRPEPRLALGAHLAGVAHACADVSDGLIADAGHIAEASGAALALTLERLPLSQDGARFVDGHADRAAALAALAAGGDDYELVMTAAPETAERLIRLALEAETRLTVIGHVAEGAGVRVSFEGRPLAVVRAGYRHV